MLKLGTLKWKGRCSRHPRYDPVSDGEGGIRGGCARCMQLLDISRQHSRLVKLMRDFGPLRERPTPSAAQDDARLQKSLFE